jgi:hypothetical protein
MIILPWALQGAKVEEGVAATYLPNPFESMFKRSGSAGSPQYASFVRKVFADGESFAFPFFDLSMLTLRSPQRLATSPSISTEASNPTQPLSSPAGVRSIFVRGARATLTRSNPPAHVFFAFHGGTDDRACLALVVQLVLQNQGLTATIVRVERAAEPTSDDRALSTKQTTRGGSAGVSEAETPVLFSQLTVHGGGGATDTGKSRSVYTAKSSTSISSLPSQSTPLNTTSARKRRITSPYRTSLTSRPPLVPSP